VNPSPDKPEPKRLFPTREQVEAALVNPSPDKPAPKRPFLTNEQVEAEIISDGSSF